MEHEGSLPHSQVPANCPYPEPDRSSPYPHIPFHEETSYYYPPIYVWVSQVVSFPQVSPPKLNASLTSFHNLIQRQMEVRGQFDNYSNCSYFVQFNLMNIIIHF